MKALDGPAAGLELDLRRCPMYLRLVQDTMALKWDALDQPDDTPGPSETVYVYRRRPGTGGVVFACTRRSSRDPRFEHGDYEHMPEVDGEALRDTDGWRTWAMSQPEIT